ncbi:hypothetical protein MtrunA17_Chr7g0254021 [Medicago truncatula]|nr:uncharacterized protein LOC11430152 isoform X2 [Medicago truncatula]XP_024625831.1 uncharacterized protein LOC11430152 isoform X2 [Medicago truncatula]RHN47534.1 hypothetical protein MtrunA17_Chr7g0254021 [Medicago truncatula]
MDEGMAQAFDLLSQMDTFETVIPDINETVNILAGFRRSLLDEGSISEHTLRCLEIMVEIPMKRSVTSYQYPQADCLPKYYHLYLEDLERMCTRIVEKAKNPFRHMSALEADVTPFMNKLSEHNVVGSIFLKKLTAARVAFDTGDRECFRRLLDALNADIIILFLKLTPYFKLVKKLKRCLRFDDQFQFGFVANSNVANAVRVSDRAIIQWFTRILIELLD